MGRYRTPHSLRLHGRMRPVGHARRTALPSTHPLLHISLVPADLSQSACPPLSPSLKAQKANTNAPQARGPQSQTHGCTTTTWIPTVIGKSSNTVGQLQMLESPKLVHSCKESCLTCRTGVFMEVIKNGTQTSVCLLCPLCLAPDVPCRTADTEDEQMKFDGVEPSYQSNTDPTYNPGTFQITYSGGNGDWKPGVKPNCGLGT